MNDEILQRLGRIESHVAHLEHQVEQLNGVIIEQGRMVEHLKKQLQRQSACLAKPWNWNASRPTTPGRLTTSGFWNAVHVIRFW